MRHWPDAAKTIHGLIISQPQGARQIVATRKRRKASAPLSLPGDRTWFRRDMLLDQALEETFPASDPVSPLSIN